MGGGGQGRELVCIEVPGKQNKVGISKSLSDKNILLRRKYLEGSRELLHDDKWTSSPERESNTQMHLINMNGSCIMQKLMTPQLEWEFLIHHS